MRNPVYTCSRCAFVAGTSALWSRYAYETPVGRVPLSVECGWCDDCATLVAIEHLPSEDDVEQLARVTELAEEHANAETDKVQHADRPERISATLNGCELDLRRTLRVRRRLRERQTPPRCLKCGGIKVNSVDDKLPQDYGVIGETPAPTSLKHPRCGGVIQVHAPRLCISFRRLTFVYDIEGNFLRSEGEPERYRGIEHLDLSCGEQGTKAATSEARTRR
jgi:hypothetical protein